ncbi:MAG: DUF58 domain-containing protein [Chromatiales bacterium]|jgi:uncharacterized protein (DUF58 family)|nr:DUF58 domain-containing protein [Chromatiales bacterium]
MSFSLATLPHRLYRLLGVERRRARRDRVVILGRNRIFILPSAQGLLYAALTFVMLLGAANYNNSLAFILTFVLIALGLIALLQTYRNLAGLRLSAGRCVPIFQGETAHFEVMVENPTRAARHALALQRGQDSPLVFHLDGTVTTASVSCTIIVPVQTERRGLLTLGLLRLHTRYPLGLFRAWVYVNLDFKCLVYPRPAAPSANTLRLTSGMRGRITDTDGNEDFIGHRAYRLGDSPRHVDWKAAARSDALLSKRFGSQQQAQCWLDWHDHEGDRETRLSRLCRAVLDAEASGMSYGLKLPTLVIAPAHGGAHRHQCLRALALFGIKS